MYVLSIEKVSTLPQVLREIAALPLGQPNPHAR
jgi:hypothetical protein